MSNLADKAIKIKGKDYVQVKDRILAFNEEFPNGSLKTYLLSTPDASTVVFKAVAIPDVDKPERYFVGHAQEVIGDGMINKSSAMENGETSAVGRALAMMGIGILDSIASADEMNKAMNRTSYNEPGISNYYQDSNHTDAPTASAGAKADLIIGDWIFKTGPRKDGTGPYWMKKHKNNRNLRPTFFNTADEYQAALDEASGNKPKQAEKPKQIDDVEDLPF